MYTESENDCVDQGIHQQPCLKNKFKQQEAVPLSLQCLRPWIYKEIPQVIVCVTEMFWCQGTQFENFYNFWGLFIHSSPCFFSEYTVLLWIQKRACWKIADFKYSWIWLLLLHISWKKRIWNSNKGTFLSEGIDVFEISPNRQIF